MNPTWRALGPASRAAGLSRPGALSGVARGRGLRGHRPRRRHRPRLTTAEALRCARGALRGRGAVRPAHPRSSPRRATGRPLSAAGRRAASELPDVGSSCQLKVVGCQLSVCQFVSLSDCQFVRLSDWRVAPPVSATSVVPRGMTTKSYGDDDTHGTSGRRLMRGRRAGGSRRRAARPRRRPRRSGSANASASRPCSRTCPGTCRAG
jgi:hypothetical protein